MAPTRAQVPQQVGGGSVPIQELPSIVGGRSHQIDFPKVDVGGVIAAREAIYRRGLACADTAAVVLALTAALTISGDGPRRLAVLCVPLFVVLAKTLGLYDRDELVLRRSTLDELPRLFHLATFAALLLWLADDVVALAPLSKLAVTTFWVTLLLTGWVTRTAARRLAGRRAPAERCLVVGDAEVLERLRAKLPGQGVAFVGSVPLERVVGDLAELRMAAREHAAHRLVIAPPSNGLGAEVLDLVRGAKTTGLNVTLVPDVLEVVGSSVEFDVLPGMTLLGVRRFELTRSSLRLKRTFDLVAAGAACVVLAPLMALIAVLIKLDSPGPVLFRQTRVGYRGEHFGIFKFRTMCDGADAMRKELAHLNEARDGLFKIADDPRITRVGRLLRKTSLDELPQLFNVLRGEMSVVGPRPLVVYEDERVTGYDRKRLSLTPGMTGPWQIAGSARVPLAEMVKMDCLYVGSWSLWSDVKICVRTLGYVLARRGQ